MNSRVNINRLPTGVAGLDEVLGGGLPEFSFNLIAGPPGCGTARAIWPTPTSRCLCSRRNVSSPATRPTSKRSCGPGESRLSSSGCRDPNEQG